MSIENLPLEKRIENALERVRPFLNKDGGDIELIAINSPEVVVRLIGNCISCPMSFSTMKFGVETTIKEFAPEITSIREVSNDVQYKDTSITSI